MCFVDDSILHNKNKKYYTKTIEKVEKRRIAVMKNPSVLKSKNECGNI